jgi:hypothetical protein
MTGRIVSSVGLALGLLAATAAGEEIQWRPVTPAPASASNGIITLKAPVADSAAVRQTSFSNGPPIDNGMLIPAKVLDAPAQPLPIGPVANDQEPGPAPGVLNPAPTVQGKPGSVIITPVPSGDLVGPPVMTNQMPGGPDHVEGFPPAEHDGNCGNCGTCGTPCGVCDDCCGGSWWNRLWGGLCGNCCDSCCGTSCGTCCNTCCDTCCDPCCGSCCAPRPCFWVGVEYLGWTVKSAPTPPLVTVNPNGSSNLALGSPGTTVAFGGSGQDFDWRSGARLTLGFALPCTCNALGFETTAFYLANSTNSAVFGPSSTTSIGRPFTNVGQAPPNNGQDFEFVNLPGQINGSVGVRTTNQFWGIEENLRYPITCGCNWKLDFLAGVRYLNLTERLQVAENVNTTTAPAADPNFLVNDSFGTRNNFYGGQVGLDGEYRWCRWYVGATGKLAAGDMHESVNINGSTTISGIAGGVGDGTFPGGLLALKGTNIGQYSRDSFALVPELDLRVGFYITERLRAYVGYDVVYASNVVRPGAQVDLNVNPTYLPPSNSASPPVGAPLPGFQFRTSDFWAQGLTAGLEWKY